MASRPNSIVVKTSRINDAQGFLVGEEFDLLEGAVPARQKEIIAGRVLARRALVELGHVEQQIMRRPNGAPCWPVGLCGSIAHSGTHVVVAVAPTSQVRSVGIDIEDGRNLGSISREVGRGDEIKALITHPFANDYEDAARLLFSAKEALFKCQSSITGDMDLDFTQVELAQSTGGLLRAKPESVLDQSIAAIVSGPSIIFEKKQGLTLAIAWLSI